jgi:hypothetical protein
MIGRSRPGIADYRLPGRVSTFDPSSVLKQIKTISSELKPKSISDIPIPKRPRLGREIRRPMTELTPEQAQYIGVPVLGPFKSDSYRY